MVECIVPEQAVSYAVRALVQYAAPNQYDFTDVLRQPQFGFGARVQHGAPMSHEATGPTIAVTHVNMNGESVPDVLPHLELELALQCREEVLLVTDNHDGRDMCRHVSRRNHMRTAVTPDRW